MTMAFSYSNDEIGTVTADTEKELKKLITAAKKAHAAKQAKEHADYRRASELAKMNAFHFYDNLTDDTPEQQCTLSQPEQCYGVTVKHTTYGNATLKIRTDDGEASTSIWTERRTIVGILATWSQVKGYILRDNETGEETAYAVGVYGTELSTCSLNRITSADFDTPEKREAEQAQRQAEHAAAEALATSSAE